MSKLLTMIKSNYQVGLIILGAFIIGYLSGISGEGDGDKAIPDAVHSDTQQPKVEVWTCSMHPQIRQPNPGKCPLCGMDLLLVEDDTSGKEKGARQLTLSAWAQQLAQVQVVPVRRRLVDIQLRLVGKVKYDETRLGYITAWVPGRLDRLYVDFTGMSVRKGDHLVEIYSPQLISAQEELLQAQKTLSSLAKTSPKTLLDSARSNLDAAKERLIQWGLTPSQVNNIIKSGKPSEHVTIYSPMSGTIIDKNAVEGAYVQVGTKIYTIADLSRVWVLLDAYEADIQWLRYGQDVEFTTESYPGRVFKGKIAFIDPVLDPVTRTVKIRVNAPNDRGLLKPEMFVHAIVHSTIASADQVIEPALAEKYLCPMHPWVIKDIRGKCDLCGMELVKPETLGYASYDPNSITPPLVIPITAPLITGKRAVVYVQDPSEKWTYHGREVVLGPRAKDYYIVHHGLSEGELVVVNGNFKIDSAMQILAKPSMMNPQGGAPPPGHDNGQKKSSAASDQEIFKHNH